MVSSAASNLDAVTLLLQSADFRDFNNEAGEEEGVELQENCGADEALISRLSSQPDITQTLAKLTFNIDHLNKQIYQQISDNYDALLQQVSKFTDMEETLKTIKDHASHLNTAFDRVKTKVADPYYSIKAKITRLEDIFSMSEILRNVVRFSQLLKRLDAQMLAGERELPMAASTLFDMESIIREWSLNKIDVLKPEILSLRNSRSILHDAGDKLVQQGLSKNNQVDVMDGLTMYYNMGDLTDKTLEIIDGFLAHMISLIQAALDVTSINASIKDTNSNNNYSGPVRRIINNDPSAPSSSASNNAAFQAKLWERMEELIDRIYETCSKVYLFERALTRKRNITSSFLFSEDLAKRLDGSVSSYFWKNMAVAFEKELKEAMRASQFLQAVFQTGYPKLLRLFRNLFNRIELASSLGSNTHTASISITTTTSADITSMPHPSNNINNSLTATNNDSLLHKHDHTTILKPLVVFEHAYLSKSLSRLLDPVNMAFSSDRAGGAGPRGNLPTRDDVDKMARIVTSELEIAKFDRILLKSVAKNVSRALSTFAANAENRVSNDGSAFNFGSATATMAQTNNIELINCTYRLKEFVWKIVDEYQDAMYDEEHGEGTAEAAVAGTSDAVVSKAGGNGKRPETSNAAVVVEILGNSVKNLTRLLDSIVEPLYSSMSRDAESIISRIHREDFGGSNKAPIGGRSSPTRGMQDTQTSSYILELSSKLRWMMREIIARMQCGEDSKDWAKAFVTRLIEYFLRHSSIIAPLNDAGKLRIASDMTQLKFSLNQIMNACNMKFETQLPGMYKAMETYKPFLFLETNQVLAAPAYTEHLPPLVVIHTLFVRAYSHHLFLPMQLYQWSEQQYSDWIDTQYLVHQLKLNELKENGGGDGSPMFVIPPPIIQILSQSISQYEQQVKAIGVKEYCMEYPVINALLYKEVQ